MKEKKKIVVLTGAGISAGSGLNTFRDSGGLWEGFRVEDVATPEAFARNPQLVLDFYNERRRQVRAAQPNTAHSALARLESAYDVRIVTQNVDDLHERAGSTRVLHLHGELEKACSTADSRYVVPCPGDQHVGDTDPEGRPMRPFIVWFGEDVPLIGEAQRMVSAADIVLVVGTSLQVYPAAGLLRYAVAAECYLVDPRPPEHVTGIMVIANDAVTGIPPLVARLLAQAA